MFHWVYVANIYGTAPCYDKVRLSKTYMSRVACRTAFQFRTRDLNSAMNLSFTPTYCWNDLDTKTIYKHEIDEITNRNDAFAIRLHIVYCLHYYCKTNAWKSIFIYFGCSIGMEVFIYVSGVFVPDQVKLNWWIGATFARL